MSDTQKHTKPNVPNLRFPGFIDTWESKPLSVALVETKARNQTNKYLKEDVLSVSWEVGIVNQIQLLGRSFAGADLSNYKIVHNGDIVYTKSPLSIFPFGIVKRASNIEGIVSTLYAVYRVIDGFDGQFIENYFAYSPRANAFLKPIVRIGAKHTMQIGNDEFISQSIRFPKLPEQKKISEFIELINQRLALQNKVIEKYESLIKALRRHIFSTIESEKEVTIADVLSYEQPTKYIVSDTEYSDNKDLTPVLTANKAFVLGYTEETIGIYDKGPCIILDDFTLDSKIVDFPFKVKSSAIKILSAKTSVHLRYIYEYLKYLKLNTEEHKRHYISEIEPMTIELPDEDAIQSIAYLFDRMDQRRQGLKRDLQLLKYQKDYLLRTLFI